MDNIDLVVSFFNAKYSNPNFGIITKFLKDFNLKQSFLEWLRTRWVSAELEPVVSHKEKSCIASFDRQLSTD